MFLTLRIAGIFQTLASHGLSSGRLVLLSMPFSSLLPDFLLKFAPHVSSYLYLPTQAFMCCGHSGVACDSFLISITVSMRQLYLTRSMAVQRGYLWVSQAGVVVEVF